MPCRERIALVLQSLPEICPQILERRDCADVEFWLDFSERRTFLFSPPFAWHNAALCESYSSNWFQHSFALPRNRRIWRLRVLRYATQLSHTVHNQNYTFVFTFFRLFVWLFFNLPVRKRPLCTEFTIRFRLVGLTFGRVQTVTR